MIALNRQQRAPSCLPVSMHFAIKSIRHHNCPDIQPNTAQLARTVHNSNHIFYSYSKPEIDSTYAGNCRVIQVNLNTCLLVDLESNYISFSNFDWQNVNERNRETITTNWGSQILLCLIQWQDKRTPSFLSQSQTVGCNMDGVDRDRPEEIGFMRRTQQSKADQHASSQLPRLKAGARSGRVFTQPHERSLNGRRSKTKASKMVPWKLEHHPPGFLLLLPSSSVPPAATDETISFSEFCHHFTVYTPTPAWDAAAQFLLASPSLRTTAKGG